MQEQPDLYSQYHEGFRRQAAEWPQQPVDAALSWLKAREPADVSVLPVVSEQTPIVACARLELLKR